MAMNRLDIAAHCLQGLMSSQNPEVGWNIEHACTTALRLADTLVDLHIQTTRNEETTDGGNNILKSNK